MLVATTRSERSSNAYELRDYGQLLRRQWWVIALAILVGVALATVGARLQPKAYTATAAVLVQPISTDATTIANARTSGEVNLDTESQLVRSIDVATAAGKAMHVTTSPRDLAGNVDVSVPPNTQVLDISYQAASPTAAQAGAHAFAVAYLQNRSALDRAAIDAQTSSAAKQLKDLTKQLETVTGKIASLPSNSSDRAFAQAQANVLTNQIGSIAQRVSTLSGQPSNPGRIIADAATPTAPSTPNRLIDLSAGVMLGLLAGLVLAVIRERRDTTVRRTAEVEVALDLPVLAEVPGRRLAVQPDRVIRAGGPAERAFARLRNAVGADLGNRRRVLLVVGAVPGLAGDFVARNLAGSFARAGRQVTLVQADLRDPRAAGDGRLGVSDVLLHRVPAEEVATASEDVRGLAVVGPGSEPELAVDELQTDAARALVEGLLPGADYVILAAPSTATSADAQTLARLVDGVIVVAELGRTSGDQLLDAVRQLGQVDAPVLGVAVVPRLRRSRRSRPAPAAPVTPVPRRSGPDAPPAAAPVESDATRPAIARAGSQRQLR